jgi:hypothetical protein
MDCGIQMVFAPRCLEPINDAQGSSGAEIPDRVSDGGRRQSDHFALRLNSALQVYFGASRERQHSAVVPRGG